MKNCPKCGKEYADSTTLCPADGEVLKKAGDDLIGQTLIGKYRIEERLDEGGMGTVYRATHVLMEKTVAIKVLHPSLAADDKIVARFTREAKAASRISHPHALTVTDFGESENGIVFLVMEYLRGRTLKDVVRQEGPMPLPRVVEIIRQVCGALEAAHSEGVVHRDLKSDNIMLEETSGGDWTKVLDFGIAKIQEPDGAIDPGLTAPNLIIGTPQYMSPEQCSQASEIDARSDIYSLGVILYELLSGHVPFTGDSPTAIMMKHLQEQPPSVLAERSDIPAAVGGIIARTLSKRPEDRFQSAGELSDAFALAATSDSLETVAVAGMDTSEQHDPLRDTNRIVVPTGSNEAPRRTANDDYDEATVVRTPTPAELEMPSILNAPPAPPPAASFNPWRIGIPALAVLLVVFAVVYALQQRSSGQSSAEEQGAPLTVDPNGQPVQSASPATGEGERNVFPTTPATGASPQIGTTITETPASNRNANAEQTLPTPDTKNTNGNENTQQNTNAEQQANTDATPTPTPRVRRIPPSLQTSPTPNADDDDAPPMPKEKKPPAATPTPATPPTVPTETKDNAPSPA
jgi:serine/threonine-protein kinase